MRDMVYIIIAVGVWKIISMIDVSLECCSVFATGLGWTGLNIANPSQLTIIYLLKNYSNRKFPDLTAPLGAVQSGIILFTDAFTLKVIMVLALNA